METTGRAKRARARRGSAPSSQPSSWALSALAHVHGYGGGSVHGVLKLENILVDANGTVKLADFDLSRTGEAGDVPPAAAAAAAVTTRAGGGTVGYRRELGEEILGFCRREILGRVSADRLFECQDSPPSPRKRLQS